MTKTWVSGIAIIASSGTYEPEVVYSEVEVLDCIGGICDRVSPKYTFYGYTVEDIKQESFIICQEALSRYRYPRPLENFLSVHVSNRLKNFIRDNYYTASDDGERIKVIQPAQLDNDGYILDRREEGEDGIDTSEMISIINTELPAAMRMDYLKMINDVYITKSRKEEITLTIINILKDRGYYEKG